MTEGDFGGEPPRTGQRAGFLEPEAIRYLPAMREAVRLDIPETLRAA